MKTKEKVEQGKGTADHLMPLGYLLKIKSDQELYYRLHATMFKLPFPIMQLCLGEGGRGMRKGMKQNPLN